MSSTSWIEMGEGSREPCLQVPSPGWVPVLTLWIWLPQPKFLTLRFLQGASSCSWRSPQIKGQALSEASFPHKRIPEDSNSIIYKGS